MRPLHDAMIALCRGQRLDERDNGGETTVQVLRGRVRVSAGSDSTYGRDGELLIVPAGRYTVTAVEDTVVLLAAAGRTPARATASPDRHGAGAMAAQTLREDGFDGDVVLLGQESERPYERPPLSKALLLGTAGRETAFVHDADWYAEHDIDLRTGVAAAAIDRDARQVELAEGQRVATTRCCWRPGQHRERWTSPAATSTGVQPLRTLSDSDRIAAALVDFARLVVVGVGWVGLEVAAAARQRGAAVTVVERAERAGVSRPLAEPAVRVSAQRALHDCCRQALAVAGLRLGILVPRKW